MAEKRIIVELEEGWSFMEARCPEEEALIFTAARSHLAQQRGISKLRNILENVEGEAAFTAEENVHLYTTIYNMCTQKPPHDYSNRLYERYREALNKYITSKVLPALREKHGEHMLRELVKRWENHKLMVRWLKRMFDYLDRYYISRYSLAPLRDVGMLCFRDLVYTVWKGPIKDGVLALIDRERAGEQIDRSLVKHVLGLFVEMGMGSMDAYEADFEAHALTNCGQFYAAQSAAWVAVDSCPEYMVKAEECLRSEKERVDAYLHASSEPKLLKEAERELLTTHQAQLLEKEHSGVAALLRDDKLDDLSRMFRLFSRVKDGLKPVADILKKHVEAEGMNKVKAVEEALTQKTAEGGSKADESEHAFMRSIIELHDKQMSTVMDCFASNSLFHKALKEAFEVFCNKKVHTKLFAELLASFADKLLKKGSAERLSDEAVEESLDKVVKLLAYVSDKDVFGERCRSMLSKRLLHEQSASEDAERILLAKLKHQCGAQFTSRMEGMVTDLALAKDMQSNFSSWMSEREEPQSKGLDLSVTVITTGFWPTSKFVELNLPQEMVACVEQFKTFYEQRSTARKLTWMYTHGTAIVNGRFAAKPIELQVNTFQAAVLLLFNDTEGELSFAEMKAALGLPEEDLVRTLHSLSCAKYALLKKTPANKKVEPTCTFSFNAAFTDKARRIRVGVPPINETRKTMETVEGDRKHSVEAAIVRVMKSRKVMVHNTLITDVTQILSPMFKPDLKMIKKRIEDLISREFISRDPEVANQYHYVA